MYSGVVACDAAMCPPAQPSPSSGPIEESGLAAGEQRRRLLLPVFVEFVMP
jgi:hypothetical protein